MSVTSSPGRTSAGRKPGTTGTVTTEEERTKAATIFDVARLAGVSHQTVSRVLNDLPNVRPATRERVERAIKQLRYIPSPAARALVTRRSRTIGLITTGLPEFGPSTTAVHFNEAAREERYAVIMASLLQADAAALRQAAETLVRQNVEAIVLITSNRSTLGLLQSMDLGVPFLGVVSQGSGLHRVSLDQYQGARRAVRHLIDLGHTGIRHVAGPIESMDALERIRGWRDALGEHNLVAHEPVLGDWSSASGYAAGAAAAGRGLHGGVLRQRPDGAGTDPCAHRGGPLGAGRGQRDRFRRHPRGRALHAAPDHHAPGLRPARSRRHGGDAGRAHRRGGAEPAAARAATRRAGQHRPAHAPLSTTGATPVRRRPGGSRAIGNWTQRGYRSRSRARGVALDSRRAPMAQLAEAGGLNPPQYGFESHWGHSESAV